MPLLIGPSADTVMDPYRTCDGCSKITVCVEKRHIIGQDMTILCPKCCDLIGVPYEWRRC